MISRIVIFTCAIACTAFCVRLNTQQNVRAEQATTELTAIAIQSQQIKTDVARAQETIPVAEKESQSLKQSIAFLQKIEFIDATAPATPEETEKKEADSISEQEQKARGYHTRLVSQYAPFYYRVGLTNEQIDRLEIILTDHWQSLSDIEAIVETKKLDDDDPSVVELRTKADQTLHNAEKELLGEEGFQRLQDYKRTLPAREFTASVAENLYFTEKPLNADQAEKLTRLLTDNNEPFIKGKTFNTDETNWAKVLEQMPSILSPEQHAGFLNTYNMHAVMPQCWDSFGKKVNSLDQLFDTTAAKKE